MKYFLMLGGLLLFIAPSYAETSDSSAGNPYLNQTYQTLQQSSQSVQKAREEAYQSQISKNKEAVSKSIAKEKIPSTPPRKEIPKWQEVLEPPSPAKNKEQEEATTSKSSENSTETEEQNAADVISPLPAPGPTEFANPAPVNLPGGVTIIPLNPDKKSGANKYP